MYILGISAFYHDSAAALIKDGKIIAAAQEERFSRVKHDDGYPEQAIAYCLRENNISADQLSAAVFYEKPLIKLERLLSTYVAITPKGFRSFARAVMAWSKGKYTIKEILRKKLALPESVPVYFTAHHESHAAAAFFPSPYNRAAIMTLDGVGEWTTTAIGRGRDNKIELLKELKFPHSLGLLYSAFTYYLGFRVNSGEYKVMGLAPYGKPRFTGLIYEKLIDLKKDGSFKLDMKYFNYLGGLTMVTGKFEKLFGSKRRLPESEVNQFHMDIAASLQKVTEEIILRVAKTAYELTGEKNLVIAGGVGLNSVANGRLLRESSFENIWIQPAAGDSGCALGAALFVWYQLFGNKRIANDRDDFQEGSLLGPQYSDVQILKILKKYKLTYSKLKGPKSIYEKCVELLIKKNVIGFFQGRMEFGPRALGSRSIIADARYIEMQKKLNLKIKKRESFRPFAPIVIEEDISKYFEISQPSPYMLIVDFIKQKLRKNEADNNKLKGMKKLGVKRSIFPAITHVDYSARIQSVNKRTNPLLYGILTEFKKVTGHSVLVNTSFNVRGEPIVESPEDAVKCFLKTEMDCLIIGSYLIKKNWRIKDAGIS